ncbi:MAG TPA: glutamate-1-semialdehyde 2,1-aminomutase [Gemmatimonadota bacterium]|nr:glutamate-1-semialdehyde 2,1-aminomutase [Gemmatimonadota bacterium]
MSGNAELFRRARALFPGGVSSPVRAFGAVGGEPYFVERAAGCRVWDADGREFVDWVSSWGAILLGHADPRVVAAVRRAVERGTSYGAPTPGEIELAERIVAAMPGIERLRFTSSGTEAAMSAVRLARAFTGRAGIVKFAGGYHGHSDALLAEAGSGVATLGIPGSAGVTEGATRDTIVLPYNDPAAVERAFAERGEEIAAVVVEPVAANMGVVAPGPGFLEALRRTTGSQGALLVFDEVITGFRVAPGGAAERFGVEPDLWCLGKVIGGGLPVGAFGGRSEVLATVAPEGPMYQAGTLSGNPLAMAAGAAALEGLAEPGTYEALEATSARLAEGLSEAAGEGVSVARVGPLLTVFFAPAPPADYAAARAADTAAYARFFHAMLERGVALPPSQFEAWFPTLAHDGAAVDATLAAAREAFVLAREAGAPA